MRIGTILASLVIFTGLFISEAFAEKTLMVFSADWCKYCKISKRDMESNDQLINLLQNYNVVKINYDVDKDLAREYNVRSIPCFIILDDDGSEEKRQRGYRNSSQLIKFLQ